MKELIAKGGPFTLENPDMDKNTRELLERGLRKRAEEEERFKRSGAVSLFTFENRDSGLVNMTGTVKRIRTDGFENGGDGILSRLPVRVGDTFSAEKAGQIREALQKTDSHLRLRTERDSEGGITLIIVVEQ